MEIVSAKTPRASASSLSLVFEYPGEAVEVVGCADSEAVLAALGERVSGEPADVCGIRDQLFATGVWHDEGGQIKLYAHGVVWPDTKENERA